FAIDLFSAVIGGYLRHLGKGNALPTGGVQTNILDGVFGVAIFVLVAHGNVVTRFALLHLRERIAADSGLNSVLNVVAINTEARCSFAVDGKVEVGLSDYPQDTKIL